MRKRIKASVRDVNTMIVADSIDRQMIERVTIIGKMDDSVQTMARLHGLGFRIIQSGPYTDREMFPTMDMERFKFVAEREV